MNVNYDSPDRFIATHAPVPPLTLLADLRCEPPEPPQLDEASLNTLDSPPSKSPRPSLPPYAGAHPSRVCPGGARALGAASPTGSPHDPPLGPRCNTERTEVSRHMPYMKDLHWLSGEAAYQNS